ncbi:hypothetical protein DRW42_27900 [Pedobacter miscanthi]|uniref:Lipoprotein n=1 Tax=Pedobacter miscanthi TaxID=2259170 RepID=A0A366KL20_9SPHI|nr:hypothetical protein DRW42_27900 [Pedobacter miscanthi]
MKRVNILIVFCLFVGCNSVKRNNIICNSIRAKFIADKEMKKYGFKVVQYVTSIEGIKIFF